MPTNTPPTRPEGFGETFLCPLTPDQFADLGRLTAIVAQIEFHVDLMIMFTLEIKNVFVGAPVLDGRSLSAKSQMLREFTKVVHQPAVASDVQAACDAIKTLLPKRNLATHGRWALELPMERLVSPPFPLDGARAVAHQLGNKTTRLPASDLPALVQEAEGAAALVFKAATHFVPGYAQARTPMYETLAKAPLTQPSKAPT